jgi:hypothetical protein
MALVPPRNIAEWVARLAYGTRAADARTVAQALLWLEQHPQLDDAGKAIPVKWTDRDSARLLFARWLADQGRLKS